MKNNPAVRSRAARLPFGGGTPAVRPAAPKRAPGQLKVLSVKENADTTLADWRVKKMVKMSHRYFDSLWNKGALDVAGAGALLPYLCNCVDFRGIRTLSMLKLLA